MSIAFCPPLPFCPCHPPESEVYLGDGSLYPFTTNSNRTLKWFWAVKTWKIDGAVSFTDTSENGRFTRVLTATMHKTVSLEEKNFSAMKELVCCGANFNNLPCHSWTHAPALEGAIVTTEEGQDPVTSLLDNFSSVYSLDIMNHTYGECGVIVSGLEYYPKFIFSVGIDETFFDFEITSYVPQDQISEFTHVGEWLIESDSNQAKLYANLPETITAYNVGFTISPDEFWPIPPDDNE